MAEIEPKTREEKLWNGEDIKPLTREEKYIKHIFDKTQTIPDHPLTRKEMLMEKAGEGGGGDITIKQLTATENGTYSEEDTAYSPVIVNVPETTLTKLTATENKTYNAPSGTAYNEVEVDVPPNVTTKNITANGTYNASDDNADGYSSVSVDVPLPQNAYLLKEIEDVEIASFNDGADLPMPKLKVAIEPVQEGSGDPSPTNVRPISGWDEVNVTVSDDVENPTVENVYTIDLDGTRYGGTLDVVSGLLTVTHKIAEYDGSEDENWVKYDSGSASAFSMCSNNGLLSNINAIFIASYLKGISRTDTWGNYDNWVSVTSGNRLVTGIQSITDVEDWKTYLSSNNLQVAYELATPQTYQLTPTMVKSLVGQNNVWADTGDILEASYFAKEVSE